VSRRKVLLTVRCKRRGHPFGYVVREDGADWVEVPRAFATKENKWKGSPLRAPLARGSGHRGACDCGMWVLMMHDELLDGMSRRESTIIR
jgi:hypothetical protein